MASVMSTVLSRLNAFLDSELEQVLCFEDASPSGLTMVLARILAYFSALALAARLSGSALAMSHIVSVFKLVQDLLEPSGVKGKSRFQLLMNKLPSEHKARWFAGAALNSAEQAMASVMSTVLFRLNAFLDSELEQAEWSP